jgi:arsenite methyltransferase
MTVKLTLDNRDLAEIYDEISDSQFNKGVALIEKLGVKARDSILDVGSGTGRLCRYAITIIGSSGSYVGIDPLDERIRIANEKNEHPNVVFKIGHAEDLSFVRDDSIDVVYLTSVFHWVIDKQAALREIFRVLKPGGKIGITTSAKELRSVSGTRATIKGILKRKPYSDFADAGDNASSSRHLATTELIQLLLQAGFTVRNIQVEKTTTYYATAKDHTRRSEASSFGNFLNYIPEPLRTQAKSDIETELEKQRTPDGIRFDGYTIFAVAQKDNC